MNLKTIIENEFKYKVDEIVARAEAVQHLNGILPNTHFAPPASETRFMFRMGYYYGCIMVSQATAEALARFIAKCKVMEEKYFIEKDERGGGVKQADRIEVMKQAKIISNRAYNHFRRILDHQRNSFHHMNSDVPVDPRKLRKMAFECVESLYSIEGAFLRTGPGGVTITDYELWDIKPDGTVSAFIDGTHI